MPYFNIHKIFLVDSYELPLKEKENIDKFLQILDDSGIYKFFKPNGIKDKSKGGRPPTDPYKLFAGIAYGFSKCGGSLREIEDRMKFDIRFRYLMDQEAVNFSTISRFCNNYVVDHQKEIYSSIIKAFINKYDISIEDCFLDGTKLEANANKYKFVWKPTTFHKNLDIKIKQLLSPYFNVSSKTFLHSRNIADYLSLLQKYIVTVQGTINQTGKGRRTTKLDKDYFQLKKYLLKSLEYEEKEEICGAYRNSFYKTDKDATAMCLKEDYYSGLGSNMHAGYNVQIIVSKGIILDYFVSQDRNDYAPFIPTLQEFYSLYEQFPTNLCADAGYGSYYNYKFLKEHNIGNYVKYQQWQKQTKGDYYEPVYFDKDGNLKCMGNRNLNQIEPGTLSRHIKRKGNKLYLVDNCRRCKYKEICMEKIKDKTQYRVFEINPEMIAFREEARRNLLTPKGIEMRVNRSTQVEGAFGVIKQDMGFDRFRRRGLENVSLEMMFVCLGYVIRKMFSLFEGKAKMDYWIAPENLLEEKMPDLPKKKIKPKKKRPKSVNEKNKKSYKRPKTTYY